MDRFCKNFEKLPEPVQTRLTVENDDKASMYSVKDLMYIHERIGIPIVFDYHHHTFNTGGLTEQEALELAMSTWGDIKPIVHYSESRTLEDETAKPQLTLILYILKSTHTVTTLILLLKLRKKN